MRAHRLLGTTASIVALVAIPLMGAGSHTVRPGETLSDIAQRHGSSTAALAAANGLANPDLIRIGTTLVIPSGSAPASNRPSSGATHHDVRSGDTISGIAARHGISTSQLRAANGLTDDVIYVGQRLRLVPLAGAATAAGGRYTVRPGDTLSTIARRHGTSVRALAAANGISDPDRVIIGRTLTLPGGASGLPCPVQGAVRFANDWGFPRSGGRFHEGNDLFAARGTPVIAVVSGIVTQRVGPIGGRQVKLAGDDGVAYYGTHLESFGRSGRVSQGTVIGYVGSSGNAAGSSPHLHFEVHPGGGAAVNPYPRIAAAC